MSNTFTGRFTRDTAGNIIGCGVAALVGLLMVLFGGSWKERLKEACLRKCQP